MLAAAKQGTPTVSTDKLDYSPGEFAVITGHGWHPNSTVTLEIDHMTGGLDGGEGHEPFDVTSDENGNFTASWFVDPFDSLGSSFILTAKCAPEGKDPQSAEWFFTDKGQTNTTVTSSLNPSTYGGSVTFTATVTTQGGLTPAPTGTVDFRDNGTVVTTITLTPLNSTTSRAQWTVSTLTGGAHTIRADYDGDTNYVSSNGSMSQTVNKANSSTALTSSTNPSLQGNSVTFSATVTGVAGGATPTGTVTFRDGAATIGTGTLNASGVATFSTSALTTGSHSITGVYNGNTNYNSSTSSTVNQSVIAKVDTTTVVSSSQNPANQGVNVTFTATVTPVSGSVVPTGTVTFKDGAATLGTGTLNSSGAATFSTSSLTTGAHTISAVYAGDTNFNGSTSANFTQTIIGTTTTTVASNANPSVVNQSVTFTATISGTGPARTGTVQFFDGGTPLGTSPVSSNAATFSTSALSIGGHSITAVYSGDSNFTGSTSAILTQTVNKGSTTTSVASSLNPAFDNNSITFTATVSVVSPATGTPTGTVTFKDGAATLGTGTLSGNTATFTSSSLSIGTHSITAAYGGDTMFNASTSPALSQVIKDGSTNINLSSNHNPQTYGQSITFSAKLTDAGGNQLSGKTITFKSDGTTIGTDATNNGGNASVTISTLTAGTHTITAEYAGDGGLTGTTDTLSQVVNKATATITLGGTTQTYDGTPKSVTATTNPAGLTVNITYNGSPTAPTNAGTYTISATISDTNYQGSTTGTLTINKATATLTLSGLTATYDGNQHAATVTTNPAGLTVVTVTYGGSTTAPTNAGTYAVVASLNNQNYQATNATGNLVIAKANATVNVTGGTFTYDGNSHPATGTVTGINNENLGTPTFSYTPGPGAPVNAGTYSVTGSFAGNTNYNPATGTGSITINKASQTITFGALADKTFGDPAFTVSATASSNLAVSFSVVSGPATISGNTVTITGAGSVTIRASQAGDGNYDAAAPVDQTFNVAKATPVVNAAGGTFTYDGDAHPATGTVTGVGGANLGAPTFTYTPGGSSAPVNAGTYSAVGSYAGDANYNPANAAPVTITINKATATLSLADTDQTYDGTARAVTVNTSPAGLTGVTVTYAGSPTVPTNAGTYAVVASLDNPNYTASNATGTLTVHKAHATISLSDLSHVYDATPKTVTATTAPAGLTTVTITYAGSPTAPTNAGSYAIVASLSNDNYEAEDATATMVIDKADQTIDFAALTDKKFGDGPVTVSATASSGLTVSFTTSAPATVVGNSLSFPANGGTTATITVTASQAGDANHNPAQDVVRTFQLLENAKPTSQADAQPAPNQAGWNKSDVTVTITATDNTGGDGVKEIRYSVNGGAETTVPGDTAVLTLSADGTDTVSYHAVDNAGNAEDAQSKTVKVDQTAPTLSASPDRQPDHNGWYTSALDITFSANDGSGSGVDNSTLTAPIHFDGPDSKNAFVEADASDIAGNASHTVFHFKYDATAPEILISGLNGKGFESATFNISASDHGSGADILLEAQLKKDNVVVWTWSGTAVLPAAPEQTISGAANDGHYHLDVRATDEAGHVTNVSRDFKIDNQAPVIEFLAGSPEDGGFYNTAQTISYSITDLDTPLTIVQTLLSMVSGADIGPVALTSGQTVAQEGRYVVHIDATDCLGHNSNVDRTFTIDTTAPVLEDAALGGSLAPAAGWYESDVNVTLSASDPQIRTAPTAIDGSGVKEIRYYATGAQVIGDSNNPQVVSGNNAVFTINTEGVTTITYWAIDVAGNATETKTVIVRYDKTKPTFDAMSDITTTATKPEGDDVTFTLPTPTDNIDQHPTIEASPASGSTFGVGETTVTVTAKDEAGQTFSRTFKVKVNNPIPVLTSIDPATKVYGDGAFTLTLKGEKFMPNSTVKVDGEERPTTFVSWTELQAAIPASDMSAAGTKHVTVSTPTPGGGDSGHAVFTIDKKHQTITFDAIPNKTYGDAPFVVSPTSDSGLDVTIEIVSGPATINGNTITISGAGTVKVKASQAGDANHYAADDVERTFTVAKAHASVVVTGGEYTYDRQEHPATGSVTGVFGEDLGTPVFEYTPGGSTAPKNAGTYSVKGTFGGNDNYETDEATALIVIHKADQTISFAAIPGHTYGDAPFDLSATATSDLDVTFTIVSGPASIANGKLTITGAGTVKVKASQAGDSNYNQAPDVEQTFEVAKATPVVHVNGGTFTYDGTAHPATGSIDGVNGDDLGQPTFTYAPGGSDAPVHAGTYGVTASFPGNANYNPASADAQIVINKADQTIDFAALADKTYGDAPITLTATASSDLTVSFSLMSGPATLNGNTLTITGAGTVVVRASQAGNGDFNPAQDVDRSFSVAKATPVISVTGGTFTYDGNAHPATGTLTGVNGDNLGAITFVYTPGPDAPVNAGTYSVEGSFAGNDNYNAVSQGATITINKAHATIALSNLSYTYDAQSHAATATTTPAGLSGVSVTYDGSPTGPTNAGSYAVVASLDNPNYEAENATGTLTIAKADPTVTVDGGTYTYDGNPHPATGSVKGVGGVDLGPLTFSYNPGDSNAPVNAGTYTATGRYAGNGNYNPATKDATITINKAHATIVLSNLAYTYDGVAHSATATTTPAGLSGVSVNYDNGSDLPLHAGSYAVKATLDNQNYEADPATGTLVIDKAEPTLHVNGAHVVYDTQAHPATGTVTGVQGEDLGPLSFSYAPGGTTAPVNAGTYTATGSFAGNGDYKPGSQNATIQIDKADQTINFAGLPNKTYGDAPMTLSATATSSLGVSFTVVSGPANLSGNTLTITGAGTVKVRASQAGNGNYNPAANVEQTFTVAKATPTVVMTGGTFTYDGLGHVATGVVNGVNGDVLPAPSISYSPSVTSPTNAGTYVATGSFAGNANYNAATGTANVVINKANLTVTADNKSKQLNAANPPLTGVITGAVTSDGIGANYSTTATPTSDVGNYPITPSLVDPNSRLSNYNVAVNNGTLFIGYKSNSGVLQPLNQDGTSVNKQGSTIPVKFQVFDSKGVAVTTPGVVASFRLVQVITGTVSETVNETPLSTTPDTAFRLSGDQWIFNLNTKNLTAGHTYCYRITLKDGSFIDFKFGLK